jgi:hypothetical protein
MNLYESLFNHLSLEMEFTGLLLLPLLLTYEGVEILTRLLEGSNLLALTLRRSVVPMSQLFLCDSVELLLKFGLLYRPLHPQWPILQFGAIHRLNSLKHIYINPPLPILLANLT